MCFDPIIRFKRPPKWVVLFFTYQSKSLWRTNIPCRALVYVDHANFGEALLHLRDAIFHLALWVFDKAEVVAALQPLDERGHERAVLVIVVDDDSALCYPAHFGIQLHALAFLQSVGNIGGDRKVKRLVFKRQALQRVCLQKPDVRILRLSFGDGQHLLCGINAGYRKPCFMEGGAKRTRAAADVEDASVSARFPIVCDAADDFPITILLLVVKQAVYGRDEVKEEVMILFMHAGAPTLPVRFRGSEEGE